MGTVKERHSGVRTRLLVMRKPSCVISNSIGVVLAVLLLAAVPTPAQQRTNAKYLRLTQPLSVLELKRDGFRYWGWYGLNEGKGIGLARSNDLVNWTKYAHNPLLTNARWPSVIAHANP